MYLQMRLNIDGAICLLDGVAGVEAQTENVWKQANAYSVPRIAFVNKMDREGSSFSKTLKSMRGRLRGWGRPLVLQWPVVLDQPPISVQAGTGGSDLDGIVDLLNLEVLDWKADQECGDTVTRTPLETFCQSHPDIGPTLLETSKQARIELVESLSELDEEIVDVYLSNDADHLAVPAKDIQAALRRVTLSGKGVPVLCGAAFKNFGVQPLLDAVVHYLPSPRDRPIPNAVDPKGQKVPIPIDDAKPCALAFKVTHDERRGPLVFVRVYSGKLFYFGYLDEVNAHTSHRHI